VEIPAVGANVERRAPEIGHEPRVNTNELCKNTLLLR
jgi:hypothetical protein